jgi:uncharacterized protein (TIGR02466 family)
MQHLIHSLFPTPIIKTKFNRDFTQEELNIVFSEEKGVSVANSSSNNRRVLENPAFAEIKKFAQDCLDLWIDKIIAPAYENSVKLQITQSWLNYTDKSGHHHLHYHPNSIISGVIYIQASEFKDQIEFQNTAINPWHVHTDKANAFNSTLYHVPVKTGDVVLFPSTMYHGVPEVQSDKTRISLAFNSFWIGKIGYSNDETNYLEIKDVY